MMPKIKLLDDIKGNDALLLQSCFPKGVIGLKSIKGIILFLFIYEYVITIQLHYFYWLFPGVLVAFIEDCRKDNSSRNVFRHKEFDDKIVLSKIQDHFIC